MTANRAPSAPPDLPGFRFLSVLGSGGFADVFLYQQARPERQVAIKVLLKAELADGSVDEFAREANAMAMLSTHPSIVTIYEASVSRDGRPYLVMEYCPRPNLQVRYRKERFGVGEALRIAIQVAGAVETSHRAGILHRDIKPANILVTGYNRPALTDFGISAKTASGGDALVGMSIPWSPPESFHTPPDSGPASDVYALAATIYTLLAGRAPFHLPGGPNSSDAMIHRIAQAALPPLGRDDVPASLDEVLAHAMRKRPEERYVSALEFARALQKVQIELAMSVTQVDLLDDSPDAPDERDDDDGLTRVRKIVSIDPEQLPMPAPEPVTARRPLNDASHWTDRGPIGVVPDLAQTALRAESGGFAHDSMQPPALDDTSRRPEHTLPPVTEAVPTRSRRRWLVPSVLGGVGLLVAGGVALAFVLGGGAPGPVSADPSGSPVAPVDAIVESDVPALTDLVGAVGSSGVVFTWTNPSPLDGDLYLWREVAAGQEGVVKSVVDATVVVPPSETGRTCIEVSLRRADGRSSTAPSTGCAP
ncbi:hypothetical protein GY21_04295 [Cryobacterium roopkundense]|uniref:non-specific serine/threonine protein kinase n=1 Tax=Cryobacterium roopkundense TaxID=1001240 RepID=A0A099JMR9_9MICO|nr:serine/threonine-protein kinase [Cryobacterium roopkundense]KGJ79654.1 hypothetical protein GY21_04295 [Cryobacterium roopkundense]MBB5642494.1 serine/threonine protein kinase [Cryobacterium roopkundense]